MEKTVKDWLLQAKADGYTWADAAIGNAEAENFGRDLDKTVKSMSEALDYAFIFARTPQGFNFWWNIYLDLN
jgi:hypothetical protein